MKKRIIGLLMILTMIVSLVAIPDMAEAAKKSYLVLIETTEGKWTAYKDLAYSSNGNLMVKIYDTSKVLGLTYQNNDKTLTIQNGKKKLTLTKNSKSYTYYNGSSSSKKTATYKTYATTIGKKLTYVIHYATLSNLSVYTQYYTGSKATDYKVLGYNGVICYSTIGKITVLPNINNVVNTDGDKLSDTNTDNDNPGNGTGNVKYDGYVEIGGVNIPKLTGFSDALDKSSWGADDYTDGDDSNDYMYDALQKYSAQMRSDIINLNDESNGGDTSQLAVTNDSIAAEINGDSSMSALILSKNAEENCYEIYVSTRLSKNPNKDQADYSTILQSTLKLFCNVITNNGNELYNIIYNSAEIDSSLLSDTSWTTVGNCQVTYSATKSSITYKIKAK